LVWVSVLVLVRVSVYLKEEQMAQVLQLKFKKFKETKNAVQYKEVNPGEGRPLMGSIYLLKSAAADLDNPEELTVTVKPA
jgi:hypothetical protein